MKPTIVASHYLEDLKWLINQEKYNYIIYSKNSEEIKKYNLPEKKVVIAPNKGKEASSYLKYIIDNYKNLPEHIAFCHGHENAWHQNKTLLEVLDDYRGEEYRTLNNPFLRNNLHDTCSYPDRNVWNNIIKHWHLITINLQLPKRLEHTMSAQFVVTKQSILRNSIDFYKKFYNFTVSQESLSDLHLGIMIEQLWYYIMTHKNIEPSY